MDGRIYATVRLPENTVTKHPRRAVFASGVQQCLEAIEYLTNQGAESIHVSSAGRVGDDFEITLTGVRPSDSPDSSIA